MRHLRAIIVNGAVTTRAATVDYEWGRVGRKKFWQVHGKRVGGGQNRREGGKRLGPNVRFLIHRLLAASAFSSHTFSNIARAVQYGQESKGKEEEEEKKQ